MANEELQNGSSLTGPKDTNQDATFGNRGRRSTINITTTENEHDTTTMMALPSFVMLPAPAIQPWTLADLYAMNAQNALARVAATAQASSPRSEMSNPFSWNHRYGSREASRSSTPKTWESRVPPRKMHPIGTPTQVVHVKPDASMWYTVGGVPHRIPTDEEEKYACPRLTCIAKDCLICLPSPAGQFSKGDVAVTIHVVRPGLTSALPRPKAIQPPAKPSYEICDDLECYLCTPEANDAKFWEDEISDDDEAGIRW